MNKNAGLKQDRMSLLLFFVLTIAFRRYKRIRAEKGL